MRGRVYASTPPRCHPTVRWLPSTVFNAILVEGENAGRLMFYGQGAGSTAWLSCPTSWLLRITAPSEATPLANPSGAHHLPSSIPGSTPHRATRSACARSRNRLGVFDYVMSDPVYAHNYDL